MRKDDLITEIVNVNRTADRTWLMTFDEDDLRRYRDNLERTREPRGRDSIWVRSGDTPAIITRIAAG
mgnify:CR=1 FL=1